MEKISWADFEKVDLRVGTITKAEIFPKAKNPAYKVWVDLGDELGVKKSSAQLTKNYSPKNLIGLQVICVTNFKPKQVANFMSEVLITGFHCPNGVILTTTESSVQNGTRLC